MSSSWRKEPGISTEHFPKDPPGNRETPNATRATPVLKTIVSIPRAVHEGPHVRYSLGYTIPQSHNFAIYAGSLAVSQRRVADSNEFGWTLHWFRV